MSLNRWKHEATTPALKSQLNLPVNASGEEEGICMTLFTQLTAERQQLQENCESSLEFVLAYYCRTDLILV